MPEIAAAAILDVLRPDLDVMHLRAAMWITHVAQHADRIVRVKELCDQLRVEPSTMMSRFFRAGLPSPKAYLLHMRLLHASFLFQSDAYSIADVAHRLEYSSPQSFGRHLGGLLGLTASEFRRRLPFETIVPRYRATYVTPYLDRLATFNPWPDPVVVERERAKVRAS